jgi:uncharacterized protein (TIGR02757 family)
VTKRPATRPAPVPSPSVRSALDRLYDSFNYPESVADPVDRVRRYPDAADREVVAFIAAGLAFGRVASVLSSIDRVLSVLGDRPGRVVRELDVERTRAALGDFVHRWIRARDMVALLIVLERMLAQSGSIEAFFAEGLDPAAADVTSALERFSTRAVAIDVSRAYGRARPRPGVAYFFSRPSSGGACKRLNLFLRWMVRRDGVDPGGWTRVPPRQLVVPLDTHVIRVGQCLGLTRFRSPGWRMAADITRSLRALDAGDPVRYDFSLCHIGMMNACGFGRTGSSDQCPLKGVCRPAARTRPASR